ncbi:MAG: fimbrillin family protein [Muribaculaceae bacterium]|nr:fimbrillin family protein [Muribaculaceae bacterium]
MRKHFFLLAAGALALTACTSEDVIDDVASTRNVIQFENVVNKLTRAEDLTTGTLQHFNVFGFYTMPENANVAHKLFDNVTVTNDGTGKWSYDPQYVKYWVPGSTYYFYAYSCGSAEELSTQYGTFSLDMDDKDGIGKPASERVMEIDNYICDNTHQHDLIFASNTGFEAQEVNASVGFSFDHLLSKLKATFTSGFGEEYDVVIKNVSVRNIRNRGDYNFKTGWANQDRSTFSPLVYLLNTKGDGGVPAETPLTVVNKIVGTSQMVVETNTAYVLPCSYQSADVNIYFEVDVKYGNDYVIKNKALTATFQPQWNPGYSYVYNISITPVNINMKEITFTLDTIKEWDPTTPGSTDLTIDK